MKNFMLLTDKAQYRQLNREIRLQLKAERTAYWNKVAEDLEEAAHRRKSNTSIDTKMRIYWSLDLSVLLYGAEPWVLLRSDLNKSEVFQMRCLDLF